VVQCKGYCPALSSEAAVATTRLLQQEEEEGIGEELQFCPATYF